MGLKDYGFLVKSIQMKLGPCTLPQEVHQSVQHCRSGLSYQLKHGAHLPYA